MTESDHGVSDETKADRRHSTELSAEKFFKYVDDAAARFIRSVFLFGAGLIGISFLLVGSVAWWDSFVSGITPIVAMRLFVLAATLVIIFLGTLFCFLWGVVVLRAAINAIILARNCSLPDRPGWLRGRASSLFSASAPWYTLAFVGMAISVLLAASLVVGLSSQAKWIETVANIVIGGGK